MGSLSRRYAVLGSPARAQLGDRGAPVRGGGLLAALERLGAVRFAPARTHLISMVDRVHNPDGSLAYEGVQQFNALTNDGQASNLQVWLRGQAVATMYLTLVNMIGANVPVKTQTMTTGGASPNNFAESLTPGSSGYNRLQLNTNTTDWPSVPALNSGDMQITSVTKTFGAFTATCNISHVLVCTVATGNAGLVLLYVPNSYFTANAAAQAIASGQSYSVTLSDKVT